MSQSQSTPTAASYDTRVEIVRPSGTHSIPAPEGSTFTLQEGEIWQMKPTRNGNRVERTKVASLFHQTSLTLSSPAPPPTIILEHSADHLSDDDEIMTGVRALNAETGRYEKTVDWPPENRSLRPGEDITYKDVRGDTQTIRCPKTRGAYLELIPPQLDASIASQTTGVMTPRSWTLNHGDKVRSHGKKTVDLTSGRAYVVRDGKFAKNGFADPNLKHPIA